MINPVTNQPLTKGVRRNARQVGAAVRSYADQGRWRGASDVLSPNDEFADFGTWDKGNLNLSELKKDEMLVHEYARSGLQLGLHLEEKLGTNPFKFGLIGSTDSHTALATADDDNFFGKHAGSEPSADRMHHPFAKFGDLEILNWETLASGYMGVWAPENTREALWDAMQRKESLRNDRPSHVGTLFWRLGLRGLRCQHPRQPATVGYQKGVPMGGDLRRAPSPENHRVSWSQL